MYPNLCYHVPLVYKRNHRVRFYKNDIVLGPLRTYSFVCVCMDKCSFASNQTNQVLVFGLCLLSLIKAFSKSADRIDPVLHFVLKGVREITHRIILLLFRLNAWRKRKLVNLFIDSPRVTHSIQCAVSGRMRRKFDHERLLFLLYSWIDLHCDSFGCSRKDRV